MAVAHASAAQLVLDGYNLHQFAKSFQVTPSIDSHDTSTLGTTSRTKTTGLKHATAQGEFFYDDTATTGSYDAIKSKYGAAVPGIVTFAPQGFALGNRTTQLYTHEVSFNPHGIVDDLVMLSVSLEAAEDAVDFGVSLHAHSAETSLPFAGTSVDNAASSANGGVAAVHVSAIAGGAPSVIIVIQHSANNSTWADLVTFTAIAAAGAQRIEVAAGTTVNRYLRATVTENGTTTSVTFVAAFSRR